MTEKTLPIDGVFDTDTGTIKGLTDGEYVYPVLTPAQVEATKSLVSGYGKHPQSLIGTLAVLGDSLGANNFSATAGGIVNVTQPRGALIWLNYYLGGPWRWAQNSLNAVAGERTDQWSDGNAELLARATPVDWLYITFPTNDVAQGVDPDVTIANLLGYVQSHQARGTRVILGTGGANTSMTTTKWAAIRKIIEWQRAMSRTGGCWLLEMAQAVCDPDTGLMVSANAYDSTTHVNSIGANKQAIAVAPQFLALARLSSRMLRINAKDQAAYNPTMTGSASGIPLGWASYGTAGARTKVSRTDIPGEWAQIVYTPASNTEDVGISQAMALTTAWSAGSKTLGVRVKGSYGDHWVCSTAGTSSGSEPAAMAAASLVGDTVTDSGGVVWTRVQTIVPGVSRVTISAEIQGANHPRIQVNFGGASGDLTLFRAMDPNASDTPPALATVASDIVPVVVSPTVTVPADATGMTVYISGRGLSGVATTVQIGRVFVDVE